MGAGSLWSTSCPLSKAEIDAKNAEQPIVGTIDFQTLMFYISAGCTIATTASAGLLMIRHLLCYTRPREQRQIFRVAFYPVVYAVLSCFSIYSYPDSIYLQPGRDLYETIALAGFFLLFVEFAAPNPRTRDSYFNELENTVQKGGRFSRHKRWEVYPGGSLRWYQSKWVALYFYFFASVVIRIVQEITQAAGRYCQVSFSPAFAHVWVLVISNIALPIGVLAVVQFYMRMKREKHFHAHNPTAKLLSFKFIILLNFLQEIIFEILTGTKTFTGTKTITIRDFSIGLPCLLVTFEMMIMSIIFHWTFSTDPYHESQISLLSSKEEQPEDDDAESEVKVQKMNPFRAIISALDPSDLAVGLVYAARLLAKGVGPWGNGSWRRSGGYKQMKGAVNDIHLEARRDAASPRYTGGLDTAYNPPTAYPAPAAYAPVTDYAAPTAYAPPTLSRD